MNYIKLMRVKHWIKNFLIFIHLFFSNKLSFNNDLYSTILLFFSFSLVTSFVYIINDINDVEKDRKHPIKKNRPIASGKISTKNALVFSVFVLIFSIILDLTVFYIFNFKNIIYSFMLEITYLVLNIFYSKWLKNIPIVDVIVLSFGFLIRIFVGSVLIKVPISNFLYLTVLTGALFLGLGKRRNELQKEGTSTRTVLIKYNKEFLDKFMYCCLTLTIVFYSLWCIDASTISRIGNSYIIWTVPFIICILMRYSLIIEGDSFGDPTDIVLKDKFLLFLIIILVIFLFCIFYLF